jgi:beta-galactosidase
MVYRLRHIQKCTSGKTGKLHVARQGVFATTPEVTDSRAVVNVKTKIENDFNEEKQFNVTNEVYSSDNELVARAVTASRLQANAANELEQEMTVLNPKLWSPDEPTLYKLVTPSTTIKIFSMSWKPI